jgi:hypothetical protein
MEETQDKIQELQNEILSLKEATGSYQEELLNEISSISDQIKEADAKNKSIQDELNSLKQDYQKSETQIVSLQYSLETAKSTLKSHSKLRNELETMNDNWEKSIRTLEFYNNELEGQLNNTENYVLNLHSRIHDTSVQCQESLVKIQSECEEIKQAIQRPSRSPSPIFLKPPVSPRSLMQISKAGSIAIASKAEEFLFDGEIKEISLEPEFRVVVISPDVLYIGENAVVVKEKSLKKIIEFNRVVKKSEYLQEINEIGKKSRNNCCIVLNSGKNRQTFVLALVQRISSLLDGKKAECQCTEVVKDNLVNLFPHDWRAVTMGFESFAMVSEAFHRLSKGKNHLLVTFKLESSVLQLLDLCEINDDQSFSESFSINSSLFLLEELMMNLSKGRPNFNKSNLTKKLQMSLVGHFFLMFLMSFDDINDLPVLGLAARLQSMFLRKKTEHEQVHRSLAMLEKGRLENFEVLRLIEKAQKDMQLMKNLMKVKDQRIQALQKQLKTSKIDRVLSLSPTLTEILKKPSKIPLPRPVPKQ